MNTEYDEGLCMTIWDLCEWAKDNNAFDLPIFGRKVDGSIDKLMMCEVRDEVNDNGNKCVLLW